MIRRTIDLRRAAKALEQIRAVPDDKPVRKAYVSYLEGLPATILGAGLGQTVAMLLARSTGGGDGNAKAYKLLATQLEEWLCVQWREGPYVTEPGVRPGETLMACIVGRDQAAYMLARAEALAYLDWLKKLGVGLLKEE